MGNSKFLMAIVIGIVITSTASAQIKVGDKKNGGIVYWIDSTGKHGLIADVKDLGKFNWRNAIVACKKRGVGWHLPTKDELNKLDENKDKIGGLASDAYWSSSDDGNDSAWLEDFSNGIQLNDDENGANYVRAVRAF